MTWLVPPGVYRIVKPGANYRQLRNYATVYVPPGGLVRYRLVMDPDTQDFLGAGVLLPNEFGAEDRQGEWRQCETGGDRKTGGAEDARLDCRRRHGRATGPVQMRQEHALYRAHEDQRRGQGQRHAHGKDTQRFQPQAAGDEQLVALKGCEKHDTLQQDRPAEAGQLGIDFGTTGLGVLIFFQHQHGPATSNDKAVAVAVIGA